MAVRLSIRAFYLLRDHPVIGGVTRIVEPLGEISEVLIGQLLDFSHDFRHLLALLTEGFREADLHAFGLILLQFLASEASDRIHVLSFEHGFDSRYSQGKMWGQNPQEFR
jgi:hypothetical protein